MTNPNEDNSNEDSPDKGDPGKDNSNEDNPRATDRQQSYALLIGLYGAATAGLIGFGATRRERVEPPRPIDIAFLGLASHKLSRLITKDVITTPVRAPFTEFDEPGNPGELNDQPVGSGLKRVVGELVTCPFCLDMWAATGLTAATVLTPKLGRAATAVLSAVALADFLHFGYTAADRLAEGS